MDCIKSPSSTSLSTFVMKQSAEFSTNSSFLQHDFPSFFSITVISFQVFSSRSVYSYLVHCFQLSISWRLRHVLMKLCAVVSPEQFSWLKLHMQDSPNYRVMLVDRLGNSLYYFDYESGYS
jgi:hypothetical protein